VIKIKRVYDRPTSDDGIRILVDRLWPRGISKDKAKADMWLRDIAPSSQLRKWFAHDQRKWEAFERKYEEELGNKRELLHRIKQIEKEKGIVTLLYSARDEEHNNAVVLSAMLRKA